MPQAILEFFDQTGYFIKDKTELMIFKLMPVFI